jgi:DEAD/DEAH box helicase domain-containing protein
MTKSPFDLFMETTNAAVIERHDVPARAERLWPAPAEYAAGPLAAWLKEMTGGAEQLRLHQSLALEELANGRNVVIATGTASGKSLVFQAAIVRMLLQGQGRALLLFPQKALGSDQERRMREAIARAGLDPELVGVIHGDIPMAQRELALEHARVILATPDTVHSWMMRQSMSPLVQRYLAELRLLVIDEAHALEGVFGSNAAYLLRRVRAARQRVLAGRQPSDLQVIAATATIVDPAGHLETLTGLPFVAITEEDNGAPFHGLTLVHVEGPGHGSPAEKLAANYGCLLADVMGDDAFILFHDSRQGIERIARSIARDDVLPYRGGYADIDRRRIEKRLHKNDARGIISTSALELGVDVPQFRIGLNIGIPQTRKAFRQRVGRIGRSSPGLFVVVEEPSAFTQLGSSLREFYEGAVEPSHIYESNRSIQFQQARCVADESPLEEFEGSGIKWPEGFANMVRMAQPGTARPSDLDHIAAIGGDSPHISYPLRAMCDVTYALRDVRNPSEKIGTIELEKALREAHPGATYYHIGKAHRVVEWRSSSYERSIMLEPVVAAPRTQALLKTCVNVSFDSAEVIDGRHLEGESGSLAEISLRVTDSVEGYRSGNATLMYHELRQSNSRMLRRQREWGSTGVVLRIAEPWFTGEAATKTRAEVAEALSKVLAMEHNIAPAEIRSAHHNIKVCSLGGAKAIDDAIVVFDNVSGGLRLSAPLFSSFETILDRLDRAVELAGEEALLPRPVIERLRAWRAGLGDVTVSGGATAPALLDGEHLVYAPESEIAVRIRGVLEDRKLLEPQFVSMGDQDVLMYKYETAPGAHAWVAHDHVQAIGGNWRQVAWNPALNQFRELVL